MLIVRIDAWVRDLENTSGLCLGNHTRRHSAICWNIRYYILHKEHMQNEVCIFYRAKKLNLNLNRSHPHRVNAEYQQGSTRKKNSRYPSTTTCRASSFLWKIWKMIWSTLTGNCKLVVTATGYILYVYNQFFFILT